jgi:hypothetical protein
VTGVQVPRLVRSRVRPAYEVAGQARPEHLAGALVRNLAEAVDGQVVYAVPTDRGRTVVESWPAGLSSVPAAALDAAVTEPVGGGGAVFVVAAARWDDTTRTLLRDTAVWLGTAARLTRLRVDQDAAGRRARRLHGELAAARTRVAKVRDLERHRLVTAITTTTLRDLAGIAGRLRGVTEDGSGLAPAQEALDELIDEFRVVVRGVFPAMLPDRGPRAALEELAATLACPVGFTGDLGRRLGWQLESGFYHAVAAALNLLCGRTSAGPVTVAFGRDDAMHARVSAPVSLLSEELRALLCHDAERIEVLGGEMACGVTDGTAVVSVRLAERVEQVQPTRADEARRVGSALYQQVGELLRQGQQVFAGRPEQARWDAVAERLTTLPRLAVVGGAVPAAAGVSVLAVDAVADRALAEEFRADDGPLGSVDAVLCRATPPPEFRKALLGGRNRVVLAATDQADEVVASLVARGPVITARRALVAMAELVRALPYDHRLRWAVDRILVDAHEFTELDLLDELEQGGLLRGVASAAARLLGGDGVDPCSRLGLSAGATSAQITAAAREAVVRWRVHGEHPATGGRDRAVCEVLVRTAERLALS